MSTLRTNALEGVDAKNSITIVAGAGNITTTNVQEGLAKVWAKFNGSSFSTSGDDTFNVTSLTDDGTGDYTITIANDFNNANFVHLSTGVEFNTLNDSANTAGTMQFGSYNNSGSRTDTARNFVAGLGDLA